MLHKWGGTMQLVERVMESRKEVYNQLKTILTSINSDYYIETREDFSSLTVEGQDGTHLYIRLEIMSNGEVRVNFSNIIIGERRKGTFTAIIQGVKESNIIKHAAITSVFSNEMICFCTKHKFKGRELYDGVYDYKIK